MKTESICVFAFQVTAGPTVAGTVTVTVTGDIARRTIAIPVIADSNIANTVALINQACAPHFLCEDRNAASSNSVMLAMPIPLRADGQPIVAPTITIQGPTGFASLTNDATIFTHEVDEILLNVNDDIAVTAGLALTSLLASKSLRGGRHVS